MQGFHSASGLMLRGTIRTATPVVIGRKTCSSYCSVPYLEPDTEPMLTMASQSQSVSGSALPSLEALNSAETYLMTPKDANRLH